MFRPDETKKTVRILVRIKAGSVVRFDSTPLPKVRDGTLGDLVLPVSSLIDEAERQELETESSVELLPAGSQVFVGLNLEAMGGEHGNTLIKSEDLKIGHGYCFAEVRLLEPLKLHHRGSSKDPCLEACKCTIPALDNVEAGSLNHAFTLLSTKYETNRISHVGNVFTRVFFRRKTRWHSLNEARGYPSAQ
jgi:hypothetical protein